MIEIKKAVTKVIYNYDFFKLIESGAPDDEYDSEIEEICNELIKVKSINELAEIVSEIFYESFGERRSQELYLEVAESIMNEIILYNSNLVSHNGGLIYEQ